MAALGAEGGEVDLARSAALRKRVDELMDHAAGRPDVSYVPSAQRRAGSAPDAPSAPAATRASMPPAPAPQSACSDAALAEQRASAAQQRKALLHQAGEMRRQHEAVDLERAYSDAQRASAAAAQRSQRDGDILADRALRKVAALTDNFRAKLAADGVDELRSLDDLGVTAADLNALRKQGVGRQSKYADAMDAARRARGAARTSAA